jgi:hypothetical protein
LQEERATVLHQRRTTRYTALAYLAAAEAEAKESFHEDLEYQNVD